MPITLLEVAKLKACDRHFYWGLLPGKQFIHMEESDALMKLIEGKESKDFDFTVLDEPTTITTWRLTDNPNYVIPIDRILNFAKILVLDNLSCYSIWDKYIDHSPAVYNDNWLHKGHPEAYMRYLFSVIYENWHESNYHHIDAKLQAILDDISLNSEQTVQADDFRNWLATSTHFYPRVVGDKYHVTRDILSKLEVGQKINLIQESFNDYDDYAIGVYLENGKQLGYFRRPVARVLYNRVNREMFSARIHFIDPDAGNNDRLIVEVNFL